MSPFGGKPLWRWAADAAQTAGFRDKYLVIGAHSSVDVPDGWMEVVNTQADRGMGTSIGAGVSAAIDHRRLVIGLADMPMMSAAHLRLIALERGPTFTRHKDGKAGCPAGFDRESFATLRHLKGDQGASGIAGPRGPVIDPGHPGILFDVDTPQDLDGRTDANGDAELMIDT
jgi:molybdenum cofactor cytidylyltransferase